MQDSTYHTQPPVVATPPCEPESTVHAPSYPSPSLYSEVGSLTLTALSQSFEIRHLPALRDATPDSPVFPRATSIQFDDHVDHVPPAYSALPLLLRAKRLVNHTRVYSWRLASIPPIWPRSLEVIELYCHSWSVPFLVPGVHHVIHLDQLASPFRLVDPDPDPDPGPSGLGEGKEGAAGDIDPALPRNEAYKSVLEVTIQWLVFAIRGVHHKELDEGMSAGKTTWELRLKRGGMKEVAWAENRVGEMLLDGGLGEGRVEKDEETGELTLLGPRIVVEH